MGGVYCTLQSVVVGPSTSSPLAQEVFSGLEFEETVVKAVVLVVSDMVGRGRPMTVTTAAAMPPVPLAAARPPTMFTEYQITQ